MRTVAITGITGFVGRHLSSAFAVAGWRVIGLTRSSAQLAPAGTATVRPFDLADARVDLTDVELLIHCAFEPSRRSTSKEPSRNLSGSITLFKSAQRQGVPKIIFVSSLSARQVTTSQYAHEKYLVEGHLRTSDIIVRPGLVIGNGGIFRAMFDSIRTFRVAPLFFGGRQPLYPIGIDDLSRAIVTLVHDNHSGTYVLAAREPITLKLLYRAMATRAGVGVLLIPLPYAPTLWLVGQLERLGLSLSISSGSLEGIPSIQSVEVPSYENIGIRIHPFADIMRAIVLTEPV